jgi:hypothetical protein
MRDPQDSLGDGLRAVERLAGRTGGSVAAGLSPNDVLVQISLPLVLILAIATRLITMGQSMSDRERSAVVLDLWKQQLILRMEQVLARWETDAGLAAFPAAARITWKGRWPADDRFQALSRHAQDLTRMDALTESLYREALTYVPPEGDAESTGVFFPLYDAQIAGPPDPSAVLHEDFVMNEERRAFAHAYLRERGEKWHQRISELQWGLVSRVVAGLPPEDALSDGRMAAQMHKLAGALSERGYPLLPAVAAAYGE